MKKGNVRMSNARIWVLPTVLYLLVVGIVFGSSLTPSQGMMIFGDDIHHVYYFFRQFFNGWIAKGIFPWWNPYLFGGGPFIANPIVNIWYPPNWLFSILPLNIAYSWHMAIHIFWACLGMYALMLTIYFKQVTSNKKEEKNKNEFDLGAWISGIIFGLSGFFVARIFAGHVDMIAAASWMPWVVGAFYQLMITPGNRNFLDPLLTSSTVSRLTPHSTFFKTSSVLEFGKPCPPSLRSGAGRRGSAKILFPSAPRYIIIASAVFAMQLISGYQTMAFFTVGIIGILTIIYCVSMRSIRPMIPVVLGGVGGVGLAAFHLLPVSEFFRQSIRTYAFPYSWHSYGAIEWRSLTQLLNPFQFGNQYTYTGPPPNFVEHSMFIGVGGLVLALIGVVFLGYKFFVRSKITYTFLAGLSFIVISIFGIWVALGPNAPIDLQYILWKWVPMYAYLRIPSRHLILVVFGLSGLVGVGAGVLFRSPNLPRSLRVLITVIIVGEMVMFGRNFIELRPVPEIVMDANLVGLLRSDRQPYRVLQNFGVWLPQRSVLDFDGVMPQGIFSATGYDPSILRPYFDYVASSIGKSGIQAALGHDVQIPYLTYDSADTIDALNIKYIIVPPDYDPFSGTNRYVSKQSDDLHTYRLYENTTVLPRFYLADRSCGNVRVVLYTPNRIDLTVDSSCDTTLMSSEVWYPGWEAYVDGEKVRIDKSNDVFRTLIIPKGKHTITYQYIPKIFMFGGVISLLTVVFLFLWYKRGLRDAQLTNI